MAAKVYRTDDVIASVRKAHNAFTHIILNRSYASIKPVLLRSEKLDVSPVYAYASWDPASCAQLEHWRREGGVLMDRNSTPDTAGSTDALIFVEAPFSMARIKRAVAVAREYVVIPRPHSWKIHEEAIDLRAPPVEALRKIWEKCRGRRMTDRELAEATGIPTPRLQYMRAGLKPVREWDIGLRLAPDTPALTIAWEWINDGNGGRNSTSRKAVRQAGHQAAVKELARLGHITLTQFLIYSAEEPNWDKLARRRAAALADLAAVRALVDSLPDHLQT